MKERVDDIHFNMPEAYVVFLITALKTHQTLFKENSYSYEMCETLKHRLNIALGKDSLYAHQGKLADKIKEEQQHQ